VHRGVLQQPLARQLRPQRRGERQRQPARGRRSGNADLLEEKEQPRRRRRRCGRR
jgi:hypothetical protein